MTYFGPFFGPVPSGEVPTNHTKSQFDRNTIPKNKINPLTRGWLPILTNTTSITTSIHMRYNLVDPLVKLNNYLNKSDF